MTTKPRSFLVRFRFTGEDPAQVIDNARAVVTCVVSQKRDWPTAGGARDLSLASAGGRLREPSK